MEIPPSWGRYNEDTGGTDAGSRLYFHPFRDNLERTSRKSRRRINKRMTISGPASPSLGMGTSPSWGRLERIRVPPVPVPPIFSRVQAQRGRNKPRSRRRINKRVTISAKDTASPSPRTGTPPYFRRMERIRVRLAPVPSTSSRVQAQRGRNKPRSRRRINSRATPSGGNVSISSDGNTVIVGGDGLRIRVGVPSRCRLYFHPVRDHLEPTSQKIQASDKQANDYFGQSAAISSMTGTPPS